MTTYTGQNGTLRNGANAMAEVRGFSVVSKAKIIDDTVAGDAWETGIAQQKSWTATINALADNTAASNQVAWAPGATIAFEGYPSSVSTATGSIKLTGSCIVEEREITTAYDGLVELKLTVKGNGPLVDTVI